MLGSGDDLIEIVCIVGRPLSEWTNPKERDMSKRGLAARNMRVVLYRELINEATQNYKEFMEKKEDAGRICELIKEIDIDPMSST